MGLSPHYFEGVAVLADDEGAGDEGAPRIRFTHTLNGSIIIQSHGSILITFLERLKKINQFVVANDSDTLLSGFLGLLVDSTNYFTQAKEGSLDPLVEYLDDVGLSVVAPVNGHSDYLVEAGEEVELAG